MAIVQMLWEDEREKEAVETAMRNWLLYGELHITNARGLTVLDPKGITYKPTGAEVQPSPSATSSPEKTASGSAANRKPRKAGERSR